MEERNEQIFCWNCKKPLSSLTKTNPDFEHQLCAECQEDDLIIVHCPKCEKERLIHRHHDNRSCKKCNGSNKQFSSSAQGVGWH